MLTGFPPPTGAGGCAQPPAPPPPSEPGGHAQLESFRSCLAAALRSRRLCLLQDYEKFKQRNQLLIQVQRAELARLEIDAAACAHETDQAQLLVQSLSAELAKLETDAAACARSTLPAIAPGEHPKDHAEDDLPPLQASSDSDEDTTEVALPHPQSLFASPPAALCDRVATGSHCGPLNGAAPRGTPSPRSYSAALLGETLNTSSPTAVVEPIRQPDRDLQTPTKSPTAAVEFIRLPDDDFQTPTRVTAETSSLSAHWVATSFPSGSTPAGGGAALGGLNVSNVHNLQSRPSTHNEPASSLAPGSCPDALVNKTKPASGRAEFFRYVCDNLPPNASTPLPFTAMDLLDLHPTVALGSTSYLAEMTCTIYWRQTAATDRFAAYLNTHPRTTRRSRSNKQARNVARASFARQALVALEGVITPGAQRYPMTVITPTSPIQTSFNCGTWRSMCCFTATRTRAGGDMASRK
jgi:hypothetical protein